MGYSTIGRFQDISAEGVVFDKGSVYDRLHKLTDLRKARGKRYSLESVLMITILAKLCGANTAHVIRHGAGYSIFESQSHGLNQNLCLFAAPDAPVKIALLRLKNLWKRPRRVTITYYAEWVLGTTRDMHQAHTMPEFNAEKHTLLASNRYNSEFGERWPSWLPTKNRTA